MYKNCVFRCVVLLLVMLLSAGTEECRAQVKRIGITLYEAKEGKDKKPWNNQTIYGFYKKKKAERLIEKIKKLEEQGGFLDVGEDDCNEMAQTDAEGYCEILLPLSGYIVIHAVGTDAQLVEVNGRLNFDVVLEKGRVMTPVDVIAPPPPVTEPVVPYACGNRLSVGPMQVYIDENATDSKARLVVSPVVTILETGDTVGLLAPFVKDGVEFQKANYRRMGFDETRDPMFKYREGKFMRSHTRDSLTVHFVLEPIDRNLHYKVDGVQVFAINSNQPYRVDSICICEGYVKDPMRFLDYKMIEMPIDRTRYERKGRAEFSKDHEKLDLKFVVGEARLDPSDTLNFKQLNQLKENMSRYMGADAGITEAVIHGSASPEGGMAINSRLCRERAEYLKGELSRFPALQEARSTGNIKITHKVATWDDVARLLESDSLMEEAGSVRAILATTKDMRKQEENIRRLPCWTQIEQNILPRLRIVDIEYNYFTNRVKTRKEIWEQYQNDQGYHQGKKQKSYEFYQLLDMLKDSLSEREVIARAAYNSVKDEDGKRAWPLAAFELAKCYSARGLIDTMLLLPYIDTRRTKMERRFDIDSESYVGWYNDEAIVALHVKMLAEAGSFASAYKVAHKLLPDYPKYRRLKLFLRCLNCEWNDPEVRDTVSASSPWNKIVVMAAQENMVSWRTAFKMLNTEPSVDQSDPKTLYMKAQLRFLLYAVKKTTAGYGDEVFKYDVDFVPSVQDPEIDNYGYPRQDWGLPMVQCCLLDEKFMNYMLYDGVFNNDYRKAFKKYWAKIKDGTEPKPEMPKPGPSVQAAEPAGQADDTDEDLNPLMSDE